MARAANTRTVTIANGETTSDAEDVRGQTVVGVITPAEFDGASITFTVSMDNSTYVALTDPDTGSAVAITAAASKGYAIDPALTRAWNYVKVVAGAQTGATVVTLAVMPV